VDANEGPHYSHLKAFIENIDMEEALTQALPLVCTKSKEQRGNFDNVVIEEFEKALVKKIADLEDSIACEITALDEQKAAVASAEDDLEAKNLADKTAQADSQAAAAARKVAEAEVTKATEECATYDTRVQEANEKLVAQQALHVGFQEGPLKEFTNLRDKEAAAPVAPVAPVVRREIVVNMDHANLSVKELKDLLTAAGVSYAGATEKDDLVQLVTRVRARAAASQDMFAPTVEWQKVVDGASLPPGLEIKLDIESGCNYARLPPSSAAIQGA